MNHSTTFYLNLLDNYLWSYIAVPSIILLGIFFCVKYKFFHILKYKSIAKAFYNSFEISEKNKELSTLQAFFASIGGCIGIGNLVGVCTAIQIGGPGAAFWMWIAAFFGMLIKYSEVYLGVAYRNKNHAGNFVGGPMYYLQKIFNTPLVPYLTAFLLAIYGTEIYMFNVISESISDNFNISKWIVSLLLLAAILFAVQGGVRRIGKICSAIIPLFIILFISMTIWVLICNYSNIPEVLMVIIKSAFTGHAAIGGFTGSSIFLAASQGIARGCYSGDIGIGYASIVQAESNTDDPKIPARLAIVGIFIDTFIICTSTVLIIMLTNTWHMQVSASHLIELSLAQYFPQMSFFMPLFIFILGYSSLIAFFFVGLKSASFLMPNLGNKIYYVYAGLSFMLFSRVEQATALQVMSIAGALLLCINIYGIFKLREHIRY